MEIKTESKRLLEQHRNGGLNLRQFLYGLNELVSTTKHEPNVIDEADGQWLIQTTNAKLIATIINSDMSIVAKSYDDNGFIRKIRAVGSLEDAREVLEATGGGVK